MLLPEYICLNSVFICNNRIRNIHEDKKVIAGVFEEHYMYEDISTLIMYIYGLVQELYFLFKECIKTATINEGLK